MTNYIPTTEVVQARYHLAGVSDDSPQFLIDAGRLVCNAEFQRWLRKVKADVWDEAVKSAHLVDTVNLFYIDHDTNPYL